MQLKPSLYLLFFTSLRSFNSGLGVCPPKAFLRGKFVPAVSLHISFFFLEAVSKHMHLPVAVEGSHLKEGVSNAFSRGAPVHADSFLIVTDSLSNRGMLGRRKHRFVLATVFLFPNIRMYLYLRLNGRPKLTQFTMVVGNEYLKIQGGRFKSFNAARNRVLSLVTLYFG